MTSREASPLKFLFSKMCAVIAAALPAAFSSWISYPTSRDTFFTWEFDAVPLQPAPTSNGRSATSAPFHPQQFRQSPRRPGHPSDLNIHMATLHGSGPIIATIHAILATFLVSFLCAHYLTSMAATPHAESDQTGPASTAHVWSLGLSHLATTTHVRPGKASSRKIFQRNKFIQLLNHGHAPFDLRVSCSDVCLTAAALT